MNNEPHQNDSNVNGETSDIDTWDPPADARVIATTETIFKAKTLVAVLADHGINAATVTHVQQGASIHPAGANYPVRVVVAPADADRARTVLDENARDAAQINWDDVELEDEVDVPAPPDHGMPIVVRLGMFAGIGLVILMIIMAIIMLIV